MFISLKKRVLNPEHQSIQTERHNDHHEYELELGWSFEDEEGCGAPGRQLFMLGQLYEEDDYLSEEGTYAPNEQLYHPCADLNLIIRVEIVIVFLRFYGHRLVRIHSTLQHLNPKPDSDLINDFEEDVGKEHA